MHVQRRMGAIIPFRVTIAYVILRSSACPWLSCMQVEENAEPAAQAVTEKGIKPAGKAVADNARPAADQVTEQGIKPAAQAVSDNAVPMTRDVMRGKVCLTWLSVALLYEGYDVGPSP